MIKNYLFDFDFKKGTVNDYLINYCKDNHIDSLNGHLGGIYAKIHKSDNKYYKLEAVYSEVKERFEVYALISDWTRKYDNQIF